MKIENETLYINRTDLDHILGEMDLEEYLSTPPSELFLESLQDELEMNGLDKVPYSVIVLNFGWEEWLDGNHKHQ